MKPARFFSLVFLILIFAFSTLLYADVPQMINYQGKITTPTGALVDTTVQITFTIYDDSTSGNVLWADTLGSVAVEKGIFSVLLGNVNPIPDTVFDGNVRYLGVKVGSDTEMSPRKAMVSTPYAYRAGAADLSAHNHWGETWTGADTGLVLNSTGITKGNGSCGFSARGTNTGVHGSSNTGTGVSGSSQDGRGVSGTSNNGTGVQGTSPYGQGVEGSSTWGSGVSGNSTNGNGVEGSSSTGNGVQGTSESNTGAGVRGTNSSPEGDGVSGQADGGDGVHGESNTGDGVSGGSNSGIGVHGASAESTGVSGESVNGTGVHASSVTGTALVVDGSSIFNCNAQFNCNVSVAGTLEVAKLTAWEIDPIILELFKVDPSQVYEKGDVLVIDSESDNYKLCDAANDTKVSGVIWNTDLNENGEIPVVILGAKTPSNTVYIKVDASYAAIQRGDLLTSSPTQGYAMKATEPELGSIIGKALESYNSGKGLIKVFVNLH